MADTRVRTPTVAIRSRAPRPASRPSWPVFDDDEIEAVTRVMRSGRVNYWTGDAARSFERSYAASLGVPHAIALHNGTLALELALWAYGIGPGDEVVTTSRTFVASASAVAMRGAVPVCADVALDSGNVTAETIAAVLTPRTKAIVVVHLGGWPVEMDDVLDLAKTHDLIVVEDVAQAHGGMYRDRALGSMGDAGAFSFCQDKIVTTGGEGGLLAMHDSTMWRRAWALKDHGKSYEAVYERDHPPGFRWLHEEFGTNWRMLEVQAAIGLLQLEKLPTWSERRRALAAMMDEGLDDLPSLRIERVPAHMRHAKYRQYVYVRPEALKTGWTRDRIMQEVDDAGVPCFSGSCSEIYLEKAFTSRGWGPKTRHPNAKMLGETSLAFQVHPTLRDEDVDHAVSVVRDVVTKATR